ncbi:hypothetical protein TMUPMC115_0944 [Tetragenococcus muriaticus PMC-11-5]|uniref:Uncharacterized protein n=1 Tax=Tetragenococcus muriaticus PMC-11-5 TaxID=1302649 RepID=A0A091C8D0_9ENTE|nr:hypothetical protein TMUPMC115_0944 [Tetragenococcus muriaticus PMC-11-5]
MNKVYIKKELSFYRRALYDCIKLSNEMQRRMGNIVKKVNIK